MKRGDVIRHLEKNGCEFLREGGSHAVYINRSIKRSTAVPRHLEILDPVVSGLCKALRIPEGMTD